MQSLEELPMHQEHSRVDWVASNLLMTLRIVVVCGMLFTPTMGSIWMQLFLPFSLVPRLCVYIVLPLSFVVDTTLGCLVALWLFAIFIEVRRQQIRHGAKN
jgi:hypothetical protein